MSLTGKDNELLAEIKKAMRAEGDRISSDHAATYKKFYDENTRAYSVSATGHDITTTEGMREFQAVWINAHTCTKNKAMAKETFIKTIVKKGVELGWIPFAVYYFMNKNG